MNQLVRLDRLGKVIHRPQPQRLHGGSERGFVRDRNQRRTESDLLPISGLDSLELRHFQIDDHRVVGVTVERRQGGLRVADGVAVMPVSAKFIDQ